MRYPSDARPAEAEMSWAGPVLASPTISVRSARSPLATSNMQYTTTAFHTLRIKH